MIASLFPNFPYRVFMKSFLSLSGISFTIRDAVILGFKREISGYISFHRKSAWMGDSDFDNL